VGMLAINYCAKEVRLKNWGLETGLSIIAGIIDIVVYNTTRIAYY